LPLASEDVFAYHTLSYIVEPAGLFRGMIHSTMNPIASTTDYIQGALEELRHVRWPTRHQAVRLSIITIIFTFASSIAYGVVDFLLGRGVAFLLLFT